MHHAATPDSTPRTAADVSRQAPALPGCCAMSGGPVDVPPASVARHAVGLSVALAPTVVVVSVDTPRVVQRDHLPPSGVPFDRARRTDILRL
jgi:hypothetical protein